MPKLPIISGKELLKLLSKKGFIPDRQKGSHVIVKKRLPDKVIVTVVPLHKRLDPGTLLAILKQAGIEREEFEQLLREN